MCAVSERSSTSNVARSLLLGCARSTFCNKTQSKHIENLLVLIEECLCAFSERSDAQEGHSKKSSAAAKDRHPKPIPSQHPDDIYTLAVVRVRVSVASPSPAIPSSASSLASHRLQYGSASPLLRQNRLRHPHVWPHIRFCWSCISPQAGTDFALASSSYFSSSYIRIIVALRSELCSTCCIGLVLFTCDFLRD